MNTTEEKVDRRRGEKKISKSGQGWTWPAQLEQLKTGRDENGLLQCDLWCPKNHTTLWDRLD